MCNEIGHRMGDESGATSEPWYRDGLRFECTRCGNCCSGPSGSVLVSDSEIAELASHLELSAAEFREIYTRSLRKGDVSLREKRNGECILYRSAAADGSGGGCSVYRQRPRQCRSWPFWKGVIHSPERWAEEAESCPGMNQGQLHSALDILNTSADDGTRSVR